MLITADFRIVETGSSHGIKWGGNLGWLLGSSLNNVSPSHTDALSGVLTPPEAARTVPHRVEGGVRDL